MIVSSPRLAALALVSLLALASPARAEPPISYTDTGAGDLVVLVPATEAGAAEFRAIVPALVENGFRVVTLTGTALSDSSSSSARASALGADLVDLIRALGRGPAYLAGSGAATGAVTWATAVAPDVVRGLVLLGPSMAETSQAPLPHARSLVLMGESDPAFAAPKQEAEAIGARLHAKVQMIDKAGALPHVDAPATVAPAMIEFMDRLES